MSQYLDKRLLHQFYGMFKKFRTKFDLKKSTDIIQFPKCYITYILSKPWSISRHNSKYETQSWIEFKNSIISSKKTRSFKNYFLHPMQWKKPLKLWNLGTKARSSYCYAFKISASGLNTLSANPTKWSNTLAWDIPFS